MIRQKIEKVQNEIDAKLSEHAALIEEEKKSAFRKDGIITKLSADFMKAIGEADIVKTFTIADRISLYLKNAVGKTQRGIVKMAEDKNHEKIVPFPAHFNMKQGMPTSVPTFAAGAPGKGKTSLLVNTVVGFLEKKKKPLVLSYEMKDRQFLNRCMAVHQKMKYPDSEGMGWAEAYRFMHSAEGIALAKEWEPLLFIKERHPGERINARDSIQFCDWYSSRNGYPDLIGLDYMGLHDPIDSKVRNPLDETIRTWTEYVKSIPVASLALAQANRDSYKTQKDRAPDMSAFAGSSQYDADGGCLLTMWRNYGPGDYDSLEIRSPKNRFGPLGSVFVRVDKMSGAFTQEMDWEEVRTWKRRKTTRTVSDEGSASTH